MKLQSKSISHGGRIAPEFAFGKPGDAGQAIVLAPNRNPHLAWTGEPAGTRSFVLVCIDVDAPSQGDKVNQAGRTVPFDLPRVDFAHWLMVDIPPSCTEIGAGSCSDGITAHGKRLPQGPDGSRQGRNDYTGWFADDPEMAGDYYGYDGPCPPFNDERVHHYHFRIHALDIAQLPVSASFDWSELQAAMAGHVLAQAALIGHYAIDAQAHA